MNKIILNINFLFAFITIALPSQITSQNILQSDNSSQIFDLKLKQKYDNKFPFQFGIEFGRMLDISQGSIYNSNSLWGYVDINLYHNITFLKFEIGKVFDGGSSDEGANFLSLGLNFKLLKAKQHRIYLQTTGLFAFGKGGAGLGFIVSPKYLFSFNKYFGISASVRYLYAGDHYLIFAAGVQFFTY